MKIATLAFVNMVLASSAFAGSCDGMLRPIRAQVTQLETNTGFHAGRADNYAKGIERILADCLYSSQGDSIHTPTRNAMREALQDAQALQRSVFELRQFSLGMAGNATNSAGTGDAAGLFTTLLFGNEQEKVYIDRAVNDVNRSLRSVRVVDEWLSALGQ